MANKVFIAPSILNANFDDLEKEIGKISAVADLLHLDIMDNKFVPNFTFDIKRAFEIIGFSKLPVDAHLMIEDPDSIAPKYAQNGCSSVTFHLEAAQNVLRTIEDIKSNGVKVGIAIKPATKFSEVEPFIEMIDLLIGIITYLTRRILVRGFITVNQNEFLVSALGTREIRLVQTHRHFTAAPLTDCPRIIVLFYTITSHRRILHL